MMTAQDDGRLDLSDHYVLSSGEYLLPKGRKNVRESLQTAAQRETWEESGYSCRLPAHNLPTLATQPVETPHTELIAVQQRLSQGIRKIIVWYVAQVDSSDQQIADTREEEGEDFEVRWVCRKDVPATMSSVEDRKIVEKALSAVASRLSCPDRSINELLD